MTVVVTGASGHLGGNLVRALLARGRRVRALVHRDRRTLEGLDVEVATGDICDAASVEHALEGAATVYHAAGYISLLSSEWPRLHAVNVVGTQNVVEACLRRGVRRLIHFSSIHALDLASPGVLSEDLASLAGAACRSPYSLSKAAGEREVRKGMAQGLDAVILNPTAILGPHDYRLSHQGQMLLALAHRRLPALVPGGFDWVDVRDVVEGAVRAEAFATAGARYLLSGHWASARDLAATVEEITGVSAPRLICPMFLAQAVAPLFTAWAFLVGARPLFTRVALDVLSSGCSVSHERATRELGYRPRPLRETLVDTFQWFAESGQLGYALSRRLLEAA